MATDGPGSKQMVLNRQVHFIVARSTSEIPDKAQYKTTVHLSELHIPKTV